MPIEKENEKEKNIENKVGSIEDRIEKLDSLRYNFKMDKIKKYLKKSFIIGKVIIYVVGVLITFLAMLRFFDGYTDTDNNIFLVLSVITGFASIGFVFNILRILIDPKSR